MFWMSVLARILYHRKRVKADKAAVAADERYRRHGISWEYATFKIGDREMDARDVFGSLIIVRRTDRANWISHPVIKEVEGSPASIPSHRESLRGNRD